MRWVLTLTILSGVFVLLLSSLTHAAPPTHRWLFENNTLDNLSVKNGTGTNFVFSGLWPLFNVSNNGSSYSAQFPGNGDFSRMSLPAFVNADFSNVTLTFWLRPNGSTTSGTRGFVFDAEGYFSVDINGNAGNHDLRWSYFDGVDQPTVSTSQLLNDSVWTFVVVQHEDDVRDMIWLNATLVLNVSANSSPVVESIGRNTMVGTVYSGDNHALNGQLDDLRFYKYRLSGSEIQNVFNCGNESGCLGVAAVSFGNNTAWTYSTANGYSTQTRELIFNNTNAATAGNCTLYTLVNSGGNLSQFINYSFNFTITGNNVTLVNVSFLDVANLEYDNVLSFYCGADASRANSSNSIIMVWSVAAAGGGGSSGGGGGGGGVYTVFQVSNFSSLFDLEFLKGGRETTFLLSGDGVRELRLSARSKVNNKQSLKMVCDGILCKGVEFEPVSFDLLPSFEHIIRVKIKGDRVLDNSSIVLSLTDGVGSASVRVNVINTRFSFVFKFWEQFSDSFIIENGAVAGAKPIKLPKALLIFGSGIVWFVVFSRFKIVGRNVAFYRGVVGASTVAVPVLVTLLFTVFAS